MYLSKKIKNIISWTAQIIAASILLQTIYFKFTSSEESIFIFNALGVEPWGRIGAGAVELTASLMLLTPRLAWMGAFISTITMITAIISHLAVLGIEVMGDGGLLFTLALIVFISSLIVLALRKKPLKELMSEM
ncbi:MAG: DoxX family protein [Spirochaetia bacterium]|nr:DoxX family protein [Spirochaetia bacterium]